MRPNLLLQSLLLLALTLPAIAGSRITLDKPIYTEVFIRPVGDARAEEVSGNLLSYDDQSLAIRTGKGERDLRWTALTATSSFTLRSRLINKKSATDWLSLGRFGWSMGAQEQARLALAHASTLDPTLKQQVQSILATPAGSAITASPAEGAGQSETRELIGPAPTTQTAASGNAGAPRGFGMLPRPPDSSPKKPTETYQKSTPEQDALAITAAKAQAADVASQFNVTFDTLETKHFLIFTDWDPQEYDFLKTNLEDAYTDVSTQFDIPDSQNVFVGKLPVYMFARFRDYAKFTDSIGFLTQPTPRTLRGYYQGQSNGSGRLVMYKPAADDIQEAEMEWAHCLVHEFTHAFVARYRTNARVPRWLNEGIAEVIAAKTFPFQGTYPYAQRMAHEHRTADDLFDDDKMPSGEWYPVMQTMVELLISGNHTAFKQMFDAIKDGMDGEAALKKYFNMDYEQLVNNWRQVLLSQ
jgi:hypothetical protein